MWDVHGHSDCSGWLQLDLPLVWSASFSYQHTSEVLYWSRSNSGVLWVFLWSKIFLSWILEHFRNYYKRLLWFTGQVGVLQYGEKVVHEFKLSDYKSVEEVVKRARNINQRGGEETNTALGINVAWYGLSLCYFNRYPSRKAFSWLRLRCFHSSQAFKHGGRRGAKKVMIVITDGESHDSADLQQVIKDCEKDGITRYAIAVSLLEPLFSSQIRSEVKLRES